MLVRLERVEHENQRLSTENQRLSTENQRLSEENQRLAETVSQHNLRIETLEKPALLPRDHPHSAAPEPETRSQFTAFGCTGDLVTLACPDGRQILTTSAYYGQYSACSDCCAPNPANDCTELVEENRPGDWATIKLLCDSQTSCQIDNLGSVVDECEAGYTSDYMQVFFDCLPLNDETGPVAFTAYASTGSPTAYSPHDVIIFNDVLENIGGHYNNDTSSFVCPWHGIYLFSLSIESSDGMAFDLYRNSACIAIIGNVSGRGSTTIVTECHRGDVMWIKNSVTAGDVMAVYRKVLFTGVMLHRHANQA